MLSPVPIRHTVNSVSQVMLQHGAMALNFNVEAFGHGLIPTLSMLGYRLWYGYFHRDFFLHNIANKAYMLRISAQTVDALIAKQDPVFLNLDLDKQKAIDNLLMPQRLKGISLARYLTKLAITEDWKMPSIFNRHLNKDLEQETGRNRAFATVMTKPDPWLHYPALILDHEFNDINNLLSNPIHCHNDDILHEVFGKKIEDNTWDPELVFDINVKHIGSLIKCHLTRIHDGSHYDKYQGLGGELLDSHVIWRKKSGPRPTLRIRTNYPKNIKGSDIHWNKIIEPLGLDQDFINDCIKRPAWLEIAVREYHKNPVYDSSTHVLWVLDDRFINLDDLAWWCNDTANVLIDVDWKFILYSPSNTYLSQDIKVSQAK